MRSLRAMGSVPALRVVTWVAFALPLMLAFNEPPSPTMLNQCLSIGSVGCWVGISGLVGRSVSARRAGSWPLMAAIGTLGFGVAWSSAKSLPWSIALGLSGCLAASAIVVWATAVVARQVHGTSQFIDFAWAICVAGAVSAAIGCIQVFAPYLPDGDLIARSSVVGRAVGNLRQPNHLSSLLLWALIALVALHQSEHLGRRAGFALSVLCMLALVLTGSRTGILGVLLLAVWGALDRHLSRGARALLMAAPVAYACLWGGAFTWAHITSHAFAGESRLALSGTDISSSRFSIWSNTLSMIAAEALTGVGVGEFNIAWSLGSFPDRPIAFFDHTHNLALQMLVELGIPLGSLAIVLLLLGLLSAWRGARKASGVDGVARRAATMMVIMIGVHSMLEYPLWYAYFLLPAIFAWTFACTPPAQSGAIEPIARRPLSVAPGSWPLVASGLAMAIAAAAAMLDYRSIVVIYDPPDNAAPLEERIARGQRSLLFGQHADYAAATAFGEPKAPLSPSQELAFKRAPHQLLDIRLMIAWSQALAAQGELDKARWLAARIREFRNPGSDEYFAPCADTALAAQAFQCQPPTRVVNWREFVQR